MCTREVVEAHFLSCLKEADVLKHRGQVMSAMQKKDHNQLWLGLVNGKYSLLRIGWIIIPKSIVPFSTSADKFDQFWAVNRRLMEPNGDQEGFKHIPIRCYKAVSECVSVCNASSIVLHLRAKPFNK